MSPRHLGCAAVITKSLARIHETNLKKQGILALTFGNPNDYDKIQEDDKISLIELNNLEPQKPVTCIITHKDGTKDEILLNHSYNKSQIGWFQAGSALNVLKNKQH
jgi:aconitate hydratase